jgi:hypothetical protein
MYCSSIELVDMRVPYGGKRDSSPGSGGGGGLSRVDSGRPWEVDGSGVKREEKRDGWGCNRIYER